MLMWPLSVVPLENGRMVTGPMLFGGLALIGCAAVRLTGIDHAGVTFCSFKAMTGHACMTCGSTRAFGYLSRFDLPRAIAIQPMVTAATLGFLVWALVDTSLALTGKRTEVQVTGRARAVLTAIVAIMAAVNWAYLLSIGA
ncbi:MAG: DUF2752 domain-containing protein [Vicinamibacteria bacterium]